MTRLLLIRHATSEWNAAGRWQGWGDPPLAPAGREEAAAAASRLAGRVNAVVSSDLLRARQTAEVIARALDLAPATVEPGVREIDVGEWTGLTLAQVEERFPTELAGWRSGTVRGAPGGESFEGFLDRIRVGLGRIADAHPRGAVLVVAHGGVIGRLERALDVYPGRGPGHLAGRWVEVEGGEIRPSGDRVALLGSEDLPEAEAR